MLIKLRLLAISTFLFLSQSTFATLYVFVGSGAWSDAANWKANLVPPSALGKGDTVMVKGQAVTAAEVDFVANSGAVIVLRGGSLMLQNPKQFSNTDGSFLVFGTLVNNTDFLASKDGTITIWGQFINQNSLENDGLITVNGGTVTNQGKLNNAVGPDGQIIVNCGSTFINTVSGIFTVGTATFNCGTDINNSGILTGTPRKV